jgi:hypothetical protein
MIGMSSFVNVVFLSLIFLSQLRTSSGNLFVKGRHVVHTPTQVLQSAKRLQPLFDAVDPKKKRPMLIATFLNASRQESVDIMRSNVKRLQKTSEKVDFAIIIYHGATRTIYRACYEDEKIASSIIHCKKTNVVQLVHSFHASYPKPVLMTELLPYLPFYEKVMILDEDISLKEFNYPKFMKVWNCAAWNSTRLPLVVQGLISELTSPYPFVTWKEWQSANLSTVIAAESKFVEQQIAAFDSFFLYWFIESVVYKQASRSLDHQSEAGMDSVWCPAAKQFAQDIYGVKGPYISCALIVGAPPFHHNNSQTLIVKRVNPNSYRTRGQMMMKAWKDEFPFWFLNQSTSPVPNPSKLNSGMKLVTTFKPNCQ